MGYAVQPAVGEGAIVVPGFEHRLDGQPELLVRILGETRTRFFFDEGGVFVHQFDQVIRRQIQVGPGAFALFHGRNLRFEVVVLHFENHVAEHVDEPAIAVVCEASVARFFLEGGDRLVVHSEIQDGIHHARHRIARARAHAHQKRILIAAELRPHRLFQTRHLFLHVLPESPGKRVLFQVIDANLRGDGETRRHRYVQTRHLREIRALATQQIAHIGAAVGSPGPKGINHLLRHHLHPPAPLARLCNRYGWLKTAPIISSPLIEFS